MEGKVEDGFFNDLVIVVDALEVMKGGSLD